MRNAIITVAALGLGLLLASSAGAEDEAICADAQTTVEIGECVRKAFDEADAELNLVWAQVMKTFKPNDYMPAKELKTWKETLTASQRAWIEFKENDCKAVSYEWRGGSGASNAVVFCLLEHTTRRTEDLKARYLDR